MLSLYSSNDIHFSNCSSLLHAIIQDADFVFQGVKSFLGACRALSDVLTAMEWVQPDISFFGEMFLYPAPSHNNFSRLGYIFMQFESRVWVEGVKLLLMLSS